MASIDGLSTYDDSDDGFIGTSALKDIRDGSQIKPDINTRDDILKIRDRIRQTQNSWKIAELSANSTGKVVHKVFKAAVNGLNNALPNLGESVS